MWKRILVFLLCLLISQALGFFVKPVLAANIYNLNSSSTYNLRYDGGTQFQVSRCQARVVDLNNNGKADLAIGAELADNNSRSDSGSLYIIYDSLIDDYSGTGNNIDLTNPANYNLRFDGASAGDDFSCHFDIADIDGDSKKDIIAPAFLTDYNGSGSGSTYIILNTLLDDYTGTGNNIDLSNTANFNIRYDGAAAGDYFGLDVNAADIDGDSKNDLVINAPLADNNSRTTSGSVYIIYNTLIDDYTGTGNIVDMAVSSNWNLRFDGATTGERFGWSIILTDDFDSDGKKDIAARSPFTDYNSRTDSGSSYLIYNTIIDNYSGTGNAVDLANSTNYNIRFDGATVSGDTVGSSAFTAIDINNNGKIDLFLGSQHASNNSRTDSGSLFIIHDSLLDNYSGTGNNVDLANSSNWNLRFDGATADDHLSYGYDPIHVADYDDDGNMDILISAERTDFTHADAGSLYIIYDSIFSKLAGTGNTIDLANSANYNIRYDGQTAAIGSQLGLCVVDGIDLNNDSKIDVLVGNHYADNNGRYKSGSLYIVYNFPHTVTATALGSSYTTSDSLTLSGAVSVSANSTTSLSGVQYSLDSNSPSSSGWTACTGTTSFSCNLSSLSEGGHTVYLRAYDTNTSYTASSAYSSASFTYDKTAPLTSWTSNDNALRTFSSPQTNVFSTNLHLPSFSFTKAKDTTAGIQKYQILIKPEAKEYYTYIDDIPHDPSGAGAGTILDETNRYIRYTDDNILVHSKRTQDQLANGGYKWKVRVLDKAGNQTDTEEKILLINTRQANFSKTWFPLVLLSTKPSFYGITTVDTKVTLVLKQNNQTILEKQTTANPESRFGINIEKPDNLQPGAYIVFLSATNLQGDYIELPEFKFTYGKKTLPQVAGAKTRKPTPTATPPVIEPTPQPTPTPTATPIKPKHCFLFWCW